MLSVCVFFFFKQKTAYEMRISDWSSDVCSSDLAGGMEIFLAGLDADVPDEVFELPAEPAAGGCTRGHGWSPRGIRGSSVRGRMFLKTLPMKGFKSFADTTALQLEPGVTVVVGPNGSGQYHEEHATGRVHGAQSPS